MYTLIIENDADTKASIGDCLKYFNRECVFANTSNEVLSLIRDKGPPNVVLLDYIGDDITVMNIVKVLNDNCSTCRVCLMTAAMNPGRYLKMFGIKSSLRKPFSVGDLYRAITNGL